MISFTLYLDVSLILQERDTVWELNQHFKFEKLEYVLLFSNSY